MSARGDVVAVVNNGREDALAVVRDLTGGLGADVAIEAVGFPATFELAVALARPGGHIANIGVHGQPATLHLEDLWIRNVTITTGLVDTYSTPTLLRLAQGHQVGAGRFATHHFTLDQFVEVVHRHIGVEAAHHVGDLLGRVEITGRGRSGRVAHVSVLGVDGGRYGPCRER